MFVGGCDKDFLAAFGGFIYSSTCVHHIQLAPPKKVKVTYEISFEYKMRYWIEDNLFIFLENDNSRPCSRERKPLLYYFLGSF